MIQDVDGRQRRSLRLRDYDYSQPGAYFLTVCVQDRACLFGSVAGGEVVLNDAGRMVQAWWSETGHKFHVIGLDEFVVMPNHVHGVVTITEPVGAPLCGCPGRPHRAAPTLDIPMAIPNGDGPVHPNKAAPALGDIVDWFKTMTTNAYLRGVKDLGWEPVRRRLWQRNYFEHIVRDDEDLARICEYIRDNPRRWAEDRENPGNPSATPSP